MQELPYVISFYTINTFYQMHVQSLIESCERFGLNRSIEGIESFGSWELNCAFKPLFILKKLEELKKAVLWVDADGYFVKRPNCFDFSSADFAVRINEEFPDDHSSKVMSGTVFVNNTEVGQKLVRLWAQECIAQLSDINRKVEFWEQTALRDVILLHKKEGKILSLPVSYTKISDHPHDQEIKEAVIEHRQASRSLKKTIG